MGITFLVKHLKVVKKVYHEGRREGKKVGYSDMATKDMAVLQTDWQKT